MFSVVPAGRADVSFAHDLARENMAAAYAAAGLSWDPRLIPATWNDTENYLLLSNGERVGVLRLRIDADAVHVGDLQVMAAHRNRGAGRFALAFAEQVAFEFDRGRLRLGVFRDSPALRLYQRAGFTVTADEGAKLRLEKALGAS